MQVILDKNPRLQTVVNKVWRSYFFKLRVAGAGRVTSWFASPACRAVLLCFLLWRWISTIQVAIQPINLVLLAFCAGGQH